MNNPESPNPRSMIDNLCDYLDEETITMSGGYHDLDEFQQLVGQGVSALPALLADKKDTKWWRMQAAGTIARDIGDPIVFPDEVRGLHTYIRDITIDWAVTRGYITEEAEGE